MSPEEKRKETCFILYLKNGEVIDFNKECKYLQNLEDPVVYFLTEKDEQILLMIVPADNILYIKSEVC